MKKTYQESLEELNQAFENLFEQIFKLLRLDKLDKKLDNWLEKNVWHR